MTDIDVRVSCLKSWMREGELSRATSSLTSLARLGGAAVRGRGCCAGCSAPGLLRLPVRLCCAIASFARAASSSSLPNILHSKYSNTRKFRNVYLLPPALLLHLLLVVALVGGQEVEEGRAEGEKCGSQPPRPLRRY